MKFTDHPIHFLANVSFKKGKFYHYMAGVIVIILALITYSQLDFIFGEGPYLVFYPVVFVVAWFLGAGPAILGSLLLAMSLLFFFVPPYFSFTLAQGELARLGIFLTSSGLITWLIYREQKIEAKLVESREWFQTSLECIGDAVMVTDVEGRVLFLNQVAEKLTGWKSREAYKQPVDSIFAIYQKDTMQKAFNPIHAALTSNKRSSLESGTVLLSKNGIYYPIEDSSSPIKISKANKTIGVVLVFRDISERQQSESLLIESAERLKLATDSSKIGIWEFNLATNTAITSFYHDEAFGYDMPVEHWGPQEFESHLHPDDKKRVLEIIEEGKNKRLPFNIDFRVVWKDGSIHWMNVAGQYDRRKNRMIGINRDITDKKMAEEALREALFYRDEFLSIASHELKTPLTSLKLHCQLFQRASKKGDPEAYNRERVDRLVEQTDQQVSRLVRLVDDMLDISRIRTGKLSVNKEEFDFAVLLEEVLERIKPQFLASPGGPVDLLKCEHAIIRGDRMRLEQVITNLLNNALRYGQGKPVKLSLVKTNKFMRLSVIDEGIGIAPEFQEKIFLRFQRAVPASEVSGLGLGLYITKQIVEAHEGKISLVSELNRGSTFSIDLPCV